MSDLTFQSMAIQNFGSYIDGPHEIEFGHQGQLIYVTGINKKQPSLGANDIGKSTLINALYWVLTGRLLRVARAGHAVEPWYNKDTVSVALTFTRNGLEHSLGRTRRPNSLTLDDQTVTQDQVTAAIGLSEEAIAHTIIIGQFNDLFLDLRPEQQSTLFSELLNLNLWVRTADLAARRARSIETSLEGTERSLNYAEGRLAEVISQKETTKKELDEFQQRKELDLETLKNGLVKENISYEELADLIEKLDIEIQELPDISADEQELYNLRSEERVILQKVATSETIKAGRERELALVNDQLNKYRDADSYCPACGQPVTDQHIDEMIAGYNIRKNKLIDECETSVSILRQHQKRLGEVANSISEIETSITDTSKQIKKLNENYNLQLAKISMLKNIIEMTNKEIERLIHTANPHKASLAELKERERIINIEIDTFKKKKAIDQSNLAQYKLWVDGFKEIRLNQIDEALEELEITVNKHAARLGLVDWEVGIHTERETAKGNVVHKFTVNIFPPDLNHPVPFDSLGGGVGTRCQLAIFFGLSEVLLERAGVSPNLEILDEPTKHLSEEGIEDLLESLKDRAIDTGRSIYFVDHQRLDIGLFDGTIFIEKTNDGSRIVA